MTTLLIAGYRELAGKTAVAAALGIALQKAGLKVSYVRASADEASDPDAVPDAEFMAGILPRPSGIPGPVLPFPPSGESGPWQASVASLDASDVTLVELPGALALESMPAVLQRANSMDARLLVVARYHQGITPQEVAGLLNGVKERVVGVILNAVPKRRMSIVAPPMSDFLRKAGCEVLAVLPEDRPLYGFTIAELASHLDGEFLCRPEMADKLIEYVMLGANAPDPAFTYFVPRPNKAVFCRANRPDIQLAALDTETRCLVLTGPGQPQVSLVYRAGDLGVSVIRVLTDTYTTVMKLNGLFAKVRFRQREKVERAVDLLLHACDVSRLVQLFSGDRFGSSS